MLLISCGCYSIHVTGRAGLARPIDSVGVSAVQKFVKGSSWSYGDKWNKTPLFYKLVGAFSNVLLFTMRYYIPDVDVSFGFLSLSRLSLFPIDELLTIH